MFRKRYRRSSFVFFAHWPDLTAQYALHRSANVVIAQPCFVMRPVLSSMYLPASVAPFFGIEAGPSVFSFFWRIRRPLVSVTQI